MVLFVAMVAMPWVFSALGPPWWVGFALFRGLANGAGMPLAASAPAYLAGLAVSTALLHPAGILSVTHLHAKLAHAGG